MFPCRFSEITSKGKSFRICYIFIEYYRMSMNLCITPCNHTTKILPSKSSSFFEDSKKFSFSNRNLFFIELISKNISRFNSSWNRRRPDCYNLIRLYFFSKCSCLSLKLFYRIRFEITIQTKKVFCMIRINILCISMSDK